jgi:DnaJ-class molecular chaperone
MRKYEITPCPKCNGLGYTLDLWYSQGTSGIDNKECFTCEGSGAFIMITEWMAATPETIEIHKGNLAEHDR